MLRSLHLIEVESIIAKNNKKAANTSRVPIVVEVVSTTIGTLLVLAV